MLLPRPHSPLYPAGFAGTEPPARTDTEMPVPNWSSVGLLFFLFAQVQNIVFPSFMSVYLSRAETTHEVQFLWIPHVGRRGNVFKHTLPNIFQETFISRTWKGWGNLLAHTNL